MKIGIYTLGCKVNQYETQAMETALRAAGHEIVAFDGAWDACIINTCTVTAVSDRKSRQIIRRARRTNPGAVVAVCGCYAQSDPETAAALGADIVGGSGDRMGFLRALEAAERGVSTDEPMARRSFEFLPAGSLSGRTRAMLKLEDGCTNFCSYCIIPHVRGPVRSLPIEDAAREARRLADEGYRELILTGIELSSYGRDLPGKPGLIDVLEALSSAAPALRLRLGSLEPRTVTEDFCRRCAALPGLCPHFHLSLQSGCDDTLRRMNRRYDTARFFLSVTLLRQFFDAPGLTTDVIVGFPGESEAEFDATLSFLRRCAFTGGHVFPYSPRPGTPAAAMADQVPHAVKLERAHAAAMVVEELAETARRAMVGRTAPVPFETEENGCTRGHAPNYMEVIAPGLLRGQVLPVTVTGVEGDLLIGRAVPGKEAKGIL